MTQKKFESHKVTKLESYPPYIPPCNSRGEVHSQDRRGPDLHMVSPLQGFWIMALFLTQGVALGYYVLPLWGK